MLRCDSEVCRRLNDIAVFAAPSDRVGRKPVYSPVSKMKIKCRQGRAGGEEGWVGFRGIRDGQSFVIGISH